MKPESKHIFKGKLCYDDEAGASSKGFLSAQQQRSGSAFTFRTSCSPSCACRPRRTEADDEADDEATHS